MSQISFLDFYCEECFLKFDNKYVFDQHFPLVHGKEIKGKKEFAIKEENFEKLQQSEKQFEKPYYKCHYPIMFDFGHFLNCSAAFPTKSHLNRHVKAQHTKNEEEFDCDECGKKFNRHDNLLKHMRYAHNLKRKTLVLPGINDELENFKSSYCEKVYTQKFSLIRHMESKHSKERNYLCNICDKSFQRKDVLQVHQQNHT